ncbi:Unknown protein sequence [Pseudomonas coronafaciens pv. oryzae]|nr:Unknown protein sequence [Pseudomonas coronafaciens pv. oryzae]
MYLLHLDTPASSSRHLAHRPNPGNDKALNNQGFALFNMAEA